MKIKAAAQVPAEQVDEGIRIRWLITDEDGAENFAMRIIEIDPGVIFDPHDHPYEHEIYVLEGKGVVTTPEGELDTMIPGKVLFIEPDEAHGYQNRGDVTLKFICVIPSQN